jgi:pimeloyl-ACP methyl ester carboxylesterase
LVAAGFQVAVPDQRGYGGSDKPASIEAYNIVELTNDVAGLATALRHQRFIVVGHDWGAPVAWNTALLHPERVRAVRRHECAILSPARRKSHPAGEFWR